MKIAIRTSLGGVHGMGHAVRMRALAFALRARGADVRFLPEGPLLEPFVAPFPVQEDTDGGEVLVVDTKARLEQAWYHAQQACYPRGIVRIDHPHATPDTCTLLVGPAVHWPAETVARLQADFAECFLYGWDYVMLSDDVTRYHPLPYEERRHRIVFCAGGTDPTRALEQMYRWTHELALVPMGAVPEMVFAVGQYASFPQCGPGPRAITTILTPFSQQLLRNASLVVGLFGITAYECLWHRTPLLCLAHGTEPEASLVELRRASHGAVTTVPGVHLATITQQEFYAAVQRCWEHPARRQEMVDGSAHLLDGRGITRVAEAILAL